MHDDSKKKIHFKLLTHICAKASRLVFTKDMKKLQTGSERATLKFKSGVSSAIIDCAALEWKYRAPAVDLCSWSICVTLKYREGKDFDDAKAALADAGLDDGLVDVHNFFS